MKKIPDLVVWSEENGYDANSKKYPTNIGSPFFKLPELTSIKNESSRKMIHVFEAEKEEIISKIEKFYQEYTDSIMVWESKISFEPIVSKTYHLYNYNGIIKIN